MQEVDKKWEDCSTFGSSGSVRGKVSALFVRKKYTVTEHMKMVRVFRQCVAT